MRENTRLASWRSQYAATWQNKALGRATGASVRAWVKGTGANDVRWPHILKAARRLNDALNAYKAPKRAREMA